MPRQSVTDMQSGRLYEALAAKMEKHGRTRAELDEVFRRLTGLDPAALHRLIEEGAAYGSLFPAEPLPAAMEVKGVVCGVRVEALEDPLMRQIRAVDLIVDKLAKGRDLDKLLPLPGETAPAPEETPLMTFGIDIDGATISGFSSPEGSVTFIPFTGRVDSPLFSGEIMPGAADVQTEMPGEARVLCARYLFRGTDGEGKACSLYVENVGRLTGEPGPIRAVPRFMTDSPALAARFRGRSFRSEVHGREGGVKILIFEQNPIPEKGD